MSKPALIAAALVFSLGAGIRIADLRLPKKINEDEEIYTAQAKQMLNRGFLDGNRATAQRYLTVQRLAIYPPPTRLGFTVPIALVMKLTGRRDLSAGAHIACGASILSLAVTGLIGLEFGPWIAALAIAFLSVFPPDLFIASRCLTDAPVSLVELSMLYCTLKIIAANHRRWSYCACLAIAGTAAVLIKETCLLLYGPCLLAALVFAVRDRDWGAARMLVGLAGLGAIIDIALMTAFTGRIGLAQELVLTASSVTHQNPYALRWQSGPGYLLVSAFLALSPLTVRLAGLGILVACLPVSVFQHGLPGVLQRREAAALAAAAVGFTGLFMLVPQWLNIRYVSCVYGPICVFAALAVWHLIRLAKSKLGKAGLGIVGSAVLLVIAVSAAADYQRFKAYLGAGIWDLGAAVVLAFDRQLYSAIVAQEWIDVIKQYVR